MHRMTFVLLCLGLGLGVLPPTFAQEGTTGEGDLPAGGLPPGGLLDSPYPGPLGQVENRDPHEACANCFTIPGMGEGYQIWESVPVAGNSEHLILRLIPNPAPLAAGETRARVDAAGEPLWYIGHQAFSGPQDTAPVSSLLDMPLIDLNRLHARHQDAIMSLPGVHGIGIVAEGIGVWILPDFDATGIPDTLEGVPVIVFVEEMAKMRGHQGTRFRPVPVGAAVSAAEPGIFMTPVGGGTLGPPIVRQSGGCCQVWSLTAAHVVREFPDEPVPTAGTLPIYQPSVQIGNLFGYVAHLFRLFPCGTVYDNDCDLDSAVTNYTTINPDIAAIDPVPYNSRQVPPYNTPTGTDPIRRLTNSVSHSINGPSGAMRTARPGHTVKVWGAYSSPRVGRVFAVNQDIVSRLHTDRYRSCCLSGAYVTMTDGDSGAAVTYGGTGRRHVLGVLQAGNSLAGWFIPSADIFMAFSSAGKPFTHYWGTKSGYRAPATTTCDPPGC